MSPEDIRAPRQGRAPANDGTTVVSIDSAHQQVTLSAAANASGATSITFTSLSWSPLLANPQSKLPATSEQTWTDSDLRYDTQFLLGPPESSAAPVSPVTVNDFHTFTL